MKDSILYKLFKLALLAGAIYVGSKGKKIWEEVEKHAKHMEEEGGFFSGESEKSEPEEDKPYQSSVPEGYVDLDPEIILKQRFASGEIDEDEYKTRLSVLRG
jgi:hypothetical protein